MVEIAHADPAAARAGARRLVDAGATSLASFGIAGALDPALPAGRLLLPRRIRASSGADYAADVAWIARLTARLTEPAEAGVLIGSDALLASAAAKQAQFAASGEVAVDMESHVLAEVAVAAGLPFLVLRAIADSATADLPRAALVGYAEGRIRPFRAAGALIAAPGDALALWRLARDTRRALSALRRFARLVGGDLLAPL